MTVPLETDDDGPVVVVVADSQTPESILLDRSNQQVLQDALQELPLHYREVLLLCEVEEMSYQEIADTLGIPAGTVMSRLSRARSAFARLWCARNCRECRKVESWPANSGKLNSIATSTASCRPRPCVRWTRTCAPVQPAPPTRWRECNSSARSKPRPVAEPAPQRGVPREDPEVDRRQAALELEFWLEAGHRRARPGSIRRRSDFLRGQAKSRAPAVLHRTCRPARGHAG